MTEGAWLAWLKGIQLMGQGNDRCLDSSNALIRAIDRLVPLEAQIYNPVIGLEDTVRPELDMRSKPAIAFN